MTSRLVEPYTEPLETIGKTPVYTAVLLALMNGTLHQLDPASLNQMWFILKRLNLTGQNIDITTLSTVPSVSRLAQSLVGVANIENMFPVDTDVLSALALVGKMSVNATQRSRANYKELHNRDGRMCGLGDIGLLIDMNTSPLHNPFDLSKPPVMQYADVRSVEERSAMNNVWRANTIAMYTPTASGYASSFSAQMASEHARKADGAGRMTTSEFAEQIANCLSHV